MTTVTNDIQSRIDSVYESAETELDEAKADLSEAKRNGAPESEIRRLEEKVSLAAEVYDDAKVIIHDDTIESQLKTLEAGISELKDESDYYQLLHMSPKDQLEFQRNDPEGFRDAMDKLPTEEKQAAYMGIQNEVQSENRFWSMMTNTQQASHDTQKSILSNFRV